MERRTLTIIFGILFFLIGIPLLFLWSFLNSNGSGRYWKITNTAISIIQKDSLTTEYYHAVRNKACVDTLKPNKVLIYLDTEYFDELKSSGEMLNARPPYGYAGNPQKITSFKLLYSRLDKNEYKDITEFLTNDTINTSIRKNSDDLNEQNFFLYGNYHGAMTNYEEVAYIFGNVNQFVSCFNTDNDGFMVGHRHDYRCVTFNIDKRVFTDRFFKLKLFIQFNDKTFYQKTYFGSLK
jgi:hypothetical protein